ncbi:hypothetical protein [Galbibacter orientalis]|uniref:hypothetical protein n=1 Tax=Galbibacter orientalis TaxID=453852 RepID=UPI00307FDFCB
MILEELIIENKRVDLIPKTVTRTIQLNNLGNVTNKQSSYTQTINLPKTANNIAIFDNLGIAGNQSKVPYNKLKCTYYVGGLSLIQEGYAIVKSTTNTHYQIVIYNGVVSLADKLEGKTLADLDYNLYYHQLNQTTYTNGVTNSNNTFIYPIAKYTEEDNYTFNQTIDVYKQFVPFKVKDIFNYIFTTNDMLVTGDLLDDESFKSEVITQTDVYNIPSSSGGGILPPTSIGTSNTNTSNIIVTHPSTPQFITKTLTFNSPSVNSNVTIVNNDTIKINYNDGDGYNLLELDLDITLTASQGNGNLRVLKNGYQIYTHSFSDFETITKVLLENVEENDEIKFQLVGSSDYGSSEIYPINISAQVDCSLTKMTPATASVFCYSNSDITQLDFVKDVLSRYGQLLNYNNLTNTYELINIDSLITDFSNADDWTNKLQSIDNESYDSSYGQINYFKYGYDENYHNTPYDGTFIIENNIAKLSNDLYTSFFNVPFTNKKYNGEPLYQIPLLVYDDDTQTYVKNDTIEPRLLKIKRITASFDAKIEDNPAFTISSSNVACLTLEETDMQYYLDNYYANFINLLQNYKVLKTKVKLSILDIYNFNFYRLIYLKQTGKYYFINSIRYNPNNPMSDVEMVEIPLYV